MNTCTWTVLSFWPNRPWYKTAATVWANVLQYVFYTVAAEGAFITADMCLVRVGWQVFVTTFAVWVKF